MLTEYKLKDANGNGVHALNSAGKIREKANDRIVPRLALDTHNLLRSSSGQKEDEPVINIVTGGSFGRLSSHQQAERSQRLSLKPQSVPALQHTLEHTELSSQLLATSSVQKQ